jgi:hypothetical protein
LETSTTSDQTETIPDSISLSPDASTTTTTTTSTTPTTATTTTQRKKPLLKDGERQKNSFFQLSKQNSFNGTFLLQVDNLNQTEQVTMLQGILKGEVSLYHSPPV